MTSIDPTRTLGSEPITPPAGVKLETPEQEQLYRATLEFERFFVQQLLKPMQSAGKLLGGEEGTGSTAGYSDMAQDQLTQAVLDGGGLGMASTLYGQLAEATGIATPKRDGEAAA
jgi:Rod binding domain-containing protein